MEFLFFCNFSLLNPLIRAIGGRGWPWCVTVFEFSILFHSGWRVINFFWKNMKDGKYSPSFSHLFNFSFFHLLLLLLLLWCDWMIWKDVSLIFLFSKSIIISNNNNSPVLIIRNWPSANDYCKKNIYIYSFQKDTSSRDKVRACVKKKWLIMENASTTKCRGDIKRQYQSKIVFFPP